MSKEAHVRRVTLNLARYTQGTPVEVVDAANRLAAADWDYSALAKADVEAIFAFCDHSLTADIVRQWEVDTSTIRDWGFPFNPDGSLAAWCQPPEARETDCKLCGHRHNRWEFLARNNVNGRTMWLGSTCVSEYQFAVDGERTAEGALARLRGALSRAKEAESAAEWRARHPDWDVVADDLRAGAVAGEWLAQSCTYALASAAGVGLSVHRYRLPRYTKRYARTLGQLAKKGYLTELTTSEAYGTLRAQASAFVEAVNKVRESTRVIDAEWADFVRDHAQVLTPSDREWVARKRTWGDRIAALGRLDLDRYTGILARSAALTQAPPAAPTPTPTPQARPVNYSESDQEYAARRAGRGGSSSDDKDLPWNR
jgi:hypothetical protein